MKKAKKKWEPTEHLSQKKKTKGFDNRVLGLRRSWLQSDLCSEGEPLIIIGPLRSIAAAENKLSKELRRGLVS